ncbi:hypothetical protein [Rhizobium mongolense]|uniref:hypothetical protein n=1 Tax=Rhizobium mongolense TaxID=57676 RepID=UPI0034A58930
MGRHDDACGFFEELPPSNSQAPCTVPSKERDPEVQTIEHIQRTSVWERIDFEHLYTLAVDIWERELRVPLTDAPKEHGAGDLANQREADTIAALKGSGDLVNA